MEFFASIYFTTFHGVCPVAFAKIIFLAVSSDGGSTALCCTYAFIRAMIKGARQYKSERSEYFGKAAEKSAWV